MLAACGLIFLPILASALPDVRKAQEEAIKLFPDLGKPDTAFNQRFLARFKALSDGNDPLLQRDDWPVIVAKGIAIELGVSPAVQEPGAKAAPAVPPPRTPFKPGKTMLDRPGDSDDGGGENTDPLRAPEGGFRTIGGRVLQRTDDGVMVQTRLRGDSGHVWIRKFDAKQGAKITVGCKRVGTYTFESVAYGTRTLDCYEPIK